MSEKEKPKLKPAEKNPWYVLATINGEEPDKETQKLNRIAWNAWAVSKLSNEQAINLFREFRVGIFLKWEGENGLKEKVEKLFKKRFPNGELPDPNSEVNFANSHFSKKVDFRNFIFNEFTSFAGSEFSSAVDFNSAVFWKAANFTDKLIFSGESNFHGTTFAGHVTFNQAIFCDNLNFGVTVFKGHFEFSETFIESISKFSHCEFEKSCNFSEAQFRNNYPNLLNTIFREKITLSAKQNTKDITYWPDPQNCKQNPEEAKATCEILREQMEAQGLHEQAHFFFRREMHFNSKIGSIWHRFPYLLFGWFSDYGHSLKRPLGALAWLWGLPTVFFWLKDCTGKCANTIGAEIWISLLKAAGLSIANILKVTGIHRTYYDMRNYDAFIQFVCGAQMLLAIPLLFLLLLGLRNRFRLK